MGGESMSPILTTFYVVNIFGTIIGCSSSALLCYMIKALDLKNDFNTLLFWMSFCEFIGFLQFSLQNLAIDYPNDQKSRFLVDVAYILFSCSLLISYFISSFMSFMLYRVIVNRKIFKLSDWKYYIIYGSTLPSLLCFITAMTYLLNDQHRNAFVVWLVSQYLFWIPVTLNVYFYTASSFHIYRMFTHSSLASKLQPFGRKYSLEVTKSVESSEYAIISVMRNYKWYPILQIFARLPLSYYLILETSNFGDNSVSLDDVYMQDITDIKRDPEKSIAYLIAELFLIFASVGFVLVFVNLNPKAISKVKKIFCLDYICPSNSSAINREKSIENGVDKKGDKLVEVELSNKSQSDLMSSSSGSSQFNSYKSNSSRKTSEKCISNISSTNVDVNIYIGESSTNKAGNESHFKENESMNEAIDLWRDSGVLSGEIFGQALEHPKNNNFLSRNSRRGIGELNFQKQNDELSQYNNSSSASNSNSFAYPSGKDSITVTPLTDVI